MLELCRTRLYRRQLLCDSFSTLGNVFTWNCSENAFSLIYTCYCLSGHQSLRRRENFLSGTGVPLAGKGAESYTLCCGTAICWAGTEVFVALPSSRSP